MVKLAMVGLWGLVGWTLAVGGLPAQAEGREPILEEAGDPEKPQTRDPLVSQRRDVEPTDWAFQALRLLAERYGCMTGFPDGTFRGDRALERYEFAAGLSICLDGLTERVNTLGDKSFMSPADLATLGRLQEEFVVELTALRGRLANPEPSTMPLEPQQFSTQEEIRALEEHRTLDPLEQVVSVSQLRDVEPTDWAFQALQALVERYGCVTGFPDGTFRGDRALERYEFAAGLSACFDWLTERIAVPLENDFVLKEDRATFSRLQEEFAVELATVRGRLAPLEKRTMALEARQFSTTTRLNGLVFLNLTGAGAGDEVQAEGPGVFSAARDPVTGQPVVRQVDDPEITFSSLAWLTLSSSFTGKDNLRLNLAVGNGDSPANQYGSAGLYNTYGVPFTDQAPSAPNDVVVRDFEYLFPVGDRLRLVVGPRINWYRYFDENAFTLFLNGASSFNASGGTQVNAVDRGAGAVALWQINDKIRLNLGYLGENTEFLPGALFNSASNPQQGLFGGTYTATAELVFSPTAQANIRLLYTRSRLQQIGGLVGGAIGEPLQGLADDGLGGPLDSSTADTFSANFDWRLGDRLGLFGRYAYGSTNIFPRNAALAKGEVNAQSFQLGLAFPDLGTEGALGTLSFGVPFDLLTGRQYLVSGGGNGGTQYEIEATYFYPLSENIAIAPAFYIIGNPNNFDDNPTIFVGNLRTQFSF